MVTRLTSSASNILSIVAYYITCLLILLVIAPIAITAAVFAGRVSGVHVLGFSDAGYSASPASGGCGRRP